MLKLHPKTLALMKEFFQGKLCSKCGKQAERMMGKAKKGEDGTYFCHDCFTPEECLELRELPDTRPQLNRTPWRITDV